MTGELIGQYRIIEKIGEGGMGAVWKARDEKLGRLVALKFLSKVGDPGRKARFDLEARAASSLNHPGIVTIYDLIDHGDQTCIVMELVAGQTLDQIIPKGGMRPEEVIRLAIQIADALATAHKAGIVHRDLKPANVIVTPEGRAKLLDFGLAKLAELGAGDGQTQTIAEGHTAEGTILGTANYMSPEQAQGKPVDSRSDIFSLGAVLYEMATGRKAFQGETTISTITAILRDEPKPLSGELGAVPRELERVISRCLRKEPDRRFQTALDVRNAMEEIQEETRDHRTAVNLAPAKQQRSVPTMWLAIGVVALAILVIAGWVVSRYKTKPKQADASIIVRPLVDLPGFKTNASFSPDGNTAVIAWDGGQLGKTTNIYAVLIDGGRPLRLTTNNSTDFSPFYSPDGRRIFFTRLSDGEFTGYSIPALGGEETRITSGYLADVTGDGQWALMQHASMNNAAQGIFMVRIQTGEERALLPKVGDYTDSATQFSPDSKWVYLVRDAGGTAQIAMRVSSQGGTPEPVRFPPLTDQVSQIRRLRCATKSGEILVEAQMKAGGTRLFLLNPDGTTAVMLPANLLFGSLSPDGRRLASGRTSFITPLYRAPAFPARGEEAIAEKVLDSPHAEYSPRFSPDGSRIAIASTRTGTSQIWLWDNRFNQGKAVFDRRSYSSGSPAWSPDGRSIAFDARLNGSAADIWVVSANGGPAVQLTNDKAEDIVPCFDPTGMWIYFSSGRAGELQLFRMPSKGGEAVQVTKGGGFASQFSPDGKFLYYLQSRSQGGLWRLEIANGKEQPVLPDYKNRNWKVLADGIYLLEIGPASRGLATVSSPGEAMFYRFATHRIEKLGFVTSKPAASFGLDISPDRKWLYYSQNDARSSDLQLVENLPVP